MFIKKNVIGAVIAATVALTGLGFPFGFDGVSTAQADPVGGYQSKWDVAPARSVQTYTVTLRGGEMTLINVYGDGSTDLDLRLYDEFGNLLASDLSSSDDAGVRVIPNRTATFVIEVTNLGYEANAFLLTAY